ncbi:MAG: hypothetical protein H7Y88_12640, partial [Phycisphaerales bacterium]|nr:hypothetical protein [Phycisphaerales bacterium]
RERGAAVHELRTLARLAGLAREADRMHGRQREVEAGQRAVGAVVAMRERPAGLGSAVERLVRLVIARGEILGEGKEAESRLEREARPAWRAMDREAARTEELVLGLLGAMANSDGAVVSEGDPLRRPDVVGVIAAHERALADLRGVAGVSVWLASEPEQERRKLAGLRILTIGQALGKPGAKDAQGRDAALVELRRMSEAMAERNARALGMDDAQDAGEAEGAGADGSDVAGSAPISIGKLDEWSRNLRRAIRGTREGHLSACIRGEPTEADFAARLKILRGACEAVEVCESLMRLGGAGSTEALERFNGDPCWELDAETVRAASAEWERLTGELVLAALARDERAVGEATRGLEACAAIRAVALRAEELKSEIGLTHTGLGQVIAHEWLADREGAMRDAALCRYLCEWAHEGSDAAKRRLALEYAREKALGTGR